MRFVMPPSIRPTDEDRPMMCATGSAVTALRTVNGRPVGCNAAGDSMDSRPSFVSRAPFGRPVVPLVYITATTVSLAAGSGGMTSRMRRARASTSVAPDSAPSENHRSTRSNGLRERMVVRYADGSVSTVVASASSTRVRTSSGFRTGLIGTATPPARTTARNAIRKSTPLDGATATSSPSGRPAFASAVASLPTVRSSSRKVIDRFPVIRDRSPSSNATRSL
jgi:hypothetical protein